MTTRFDYIATTAQILEMVLAVYRKRIGLEEIALESAFGNVYRGYRECTWCLLPGIW